MIALLLLAALCLQPGQPNILLIVADDLGWSDVSATETPVLAALAATGTTYTNLHTYPNCSPTRAALWSGESANYSGIGNIVMYEGAEAMSLNANTVAERLGWRGYSTHLNGKWHLSSGSNMEAYGPVQQGFATWVGVDNRFNGFGVPVSWYDYDTVTEDCLGPVYGEVADEYITSWQVDQALAAIPSLPEPWFYALCLYAPHAPYDDDPPGYVTNGSEADIHSAVIRHMDDEIGRLAVGLGADLEGTVVVFMGDNGRPSFLDPSGTGKGYLYETGTHAPLVIQGAGIPVGVVDDRLAQPEDVALTLATLGGGEWLPTPGYDLLGTEERSVSMVERFTPNFSALPDKHAAAAWTGDYVLIRPFQGTQAPWVPGQDELYNLSLDPTQSYPIPSPYSGDDLASYQTLDAALQD